MNVIVPSGAGVGQHVEVTLCSSALVQAADVGLRCLPSEPPLWHLPAGQPRSRVRPAAKAVWDRAAQQGILSGTGGTPHCSRSRFMPCRELRRLGRPTRHQSDARLRPRPAWSTSSSFALRDRRRPPRRERCAAVPRVADGSLRGLAAPVAQYAAAERPDAPDPRLARCASPPGT